MILLNRDQRRLTPEKTAFCYDIQVIFALGKKNTIFIKCHFKTKKITKMSKVFHVETTSQILFELSNRYRIITTNDQIVNIDQNVELTVTLYKQEKRSIR